MSRFLSLLLLIAGIGVAGPLAPAAAQSGGCPAAMPPPERRACLDARLLAAETELATVRRDSDTAIETDGGGDLSAEDRREWADVFARTLSLWTRFRDAACAPRLLAFERNLDSQAAEMAGLACRLAITRVMIQDLTHRFRNPQAAPPRASFASAGRSPSRRDVISAEGDQPLCRHPGRGGDYQPLTTCYERHVQRVDRELNALWVRALAAIRERAGLSEADRAAWVEALRAAQRPWAELRDTGCRAETFETPNRYANSIYSSLVGPCLIVETEERIRALRTTYRLR
jgi:uncharacterized protein YecT (DUF1311 family)